MRRFGLLLMVAVCLLTSVQLRGSESPAALSVGWHGPVSVAANDTQVLVAEQDSHTLAILDARSGAVQNRVALPGPANGVCFGSAGLALVACGALDGSLCLVDVKKAQLVATIPLGHTPVSPVVDAAGKTAWVCLRFENALVAVDLVERKVISRINVGREPMACAITLDGKTVVVAQHLPEQAATASWIAATVSFVDVAANRVSATLQLPNGSTSVRGLCVSPDGAFAYVSHVLAHYQLPTTQLERGWMNNHAISVLDLSQRTLLNTVLIDSSTQGSANPWGVTCTADGKWLAVTCAGTHELIAIGRLALQQRLVEAVTGKGKKKPVVDAASVKHDMEFLKGAYRRISLPGNGPRSVSADRTTVWVSMYFSDQLVRLDLAETNAVVKMVPLGPAPVESLARTGERIFNDATLCLQHWQSCATCHPDGRADTLNWDLLNDGIGNPKNTRSMVGATQAGPVMALGVRDSATTAIRAGFRYILFHPPTEADVIAVYAYLQSLQPLPSPCRADAPAAIRGKEIYARALCIQCHPGAESTDHRLYDVGTGPDPVTGALQYTTPTLQELWRTAPYLHDGRAATLRDVLTQFNIANRHGDTQHLSLAELDDLIAYLLTL